MEGGGGWGGGGGGLDMQAWAFIHILVRVQGICMGILRALGILITAHGR